MINSKERQFNVFKLTSGDIIYVPILEFAIFKNYKIVKEGVNKDREVIISITYYSLLNSAKYHTRTRHSRFRRVAAAHINNLNLEEIARASSIYSKYKEEFEYNPITNATPIKDKVSEIIEDLYLKNKSNTLNEEEYLFEMVNKLTDFTNYKDFMFENFKLKEDYIFQLIQYADIYREVRGKVV
jgi:hypothetical protein